MKNVRLFPFAAVFAIALLVSGCHLIPGYQGPIKVIEPSEADIELYETIGEDFQVYYLADDSLSTTTITLYSETLTSWKNEGSTWVTYQVVAPEYTAYLNEDETLSSSSVALRKDTVMGWKLFLERETPAPEGVFIP